MTGSKILEEFNEYQYLGRLITAGNREMIANIDNNNNSVAEIWSIPTFPERQETTNTFEKNDNGKPP